jgi:hypothetical protein|tara:strand:- start:62 stop:1591 length:1530 start_codon:yes stop_codon:yes gene_type:complete
MQAAHMSFEEEVLKLRRECRKLRQDNARYQRFSDRPDKLKAKIITLKAENKLLKKENAKLKNVQKTQETEIENLKLIVEELRRVIFGSGKKKSKNKEPEDDNNSGNNQSGNFGSKSRKKADRSKESYRRSAPKEEEVTDTYEHKMSHCPDCGTLLSQLKIITRYIEDLQNLAQLYKLLKRVEKHLITTGYCSRCKKRQVAAAINPQISCLGSEVKKFIAYSIIIMRQSFEQVQRFLWDTAKLRVSDGEIATILVEQAHKLTPERNRLLNKVRGDPGRHYDESPWKTQGGQGNYTWVTTGTKGEEAVFLMGKSRGKGNAVELQGPIDNQVGITDDYPAYQNMFAKHQLCFSHPKRKLRDLKNSTSLPKSRRKICTNTYRQFSGLYSELESTLATKYNKDAWLTKRKQYLMRLQTISQIKLGEPLKLRQIKEGLQRNSEKYFTCLLQPGIPADNNKAERALRHIVLKRKISYGSKSQRGANATAILCTTLLSKWWDKPDSFFEAYDQMLAQ